MKPVLSRAQMRAFDAHAITQCSVPGLLLMENAGRGATDVLVRELLDGAKHLKSLWKERPELFRQIHYHARKLIESGIAAGELRNLDPAMTVLSVTSIVCFLTAARHSHALFLDERRSQPQTWKQHLMTLLLDGLRAR